jgi:hypothetical protein
LWYLAIIMAQKQVSLRLEEAQHENLKLRGTFERRSVNDIISDAIREYSERHPISEEDMLDMVRRIMKEDASLLKALADA